MSKTPYFLEYKFENAGRIAYMIFIILKNWKNRSESRFLIEPNRFELLPNSSKTVKFYLSAENTFCIDEEFTIEGCSVHFPIRELFRESLLKACIIRPSVSFFESEVVINCFYNDEANSHSSELVFELKARLSLSFIFSEPIKIINKSNLPLPIALKVEGEFTLSEQFEERVKFDLKIKESREILVFFNSKLIKESCVAQSFSGKLKAYSLGKLQCTMNLQANIIYPTVEISCKELTIINNMLPRACKFSITNQGEMESNFSLSFDENSMIVTKIQEQRQEKLLNVAQSLMKQKCNLRETFFKPDTKELEIQSIINEVLDFVVESKFSESKETEIVSTENEKIEKLKKSKSAVNDHPTEKADSSEPLAMSSDDEVTLNDIRKFFKQLTRASSKTLCIGEENTKETIETHEGADERSAVEKFLRLSQVKGRLKPQESRVISVFFTGSDERELNER